MFAVIKTGGKQYKVAAGDVIAVEKLAGEPGSHIDLETVLAIGEGAKLTLGKPFLEGAAVTAEVLEQARDDKIIVFKKKRRQNYRRKHGHRQALTLLKITDIYPAGATRKAKPAPKPKAEVKAPEKKAAEKAPKKAAPKKEAKAKKAPAKKAKPAAKKAKRKEKK